MAALFFLIFSYSDLMTKSCHSAKYQSGLMPRKAAAVPVVVVADYFPFLWLLVNSSRLCFVTEKVLC